MSKKPSGTVDQGRSGFIVTPHNTNMIKDDAGNAKYQWEEVALRCGNAGTITVLFADDDTAVLFENVQAGEYIPGIVRQVKATGTTCTNIVAMAK